MPSALGSLPPRSLILNVFTDHADGVKKLSLIGYDELSLMLAGCYNRQKVCPNCSEMFGVPICSLISLRFFAANDCECVCHGALHLCRAEGAIAAMEVEASC